MTEREPPISKNQRWMNLTVVGLVSQVGCLTLIIILAALFAGMYVDSRLGTRPWWTIGMILGSIPVSLVVMFFTARAALKKLKPLPEREIQNQTEETIGKTS